MPNLMAAMRNWVQRLDSSEVPVEEQDKRVAVVHCKAGKGRSGTVACSYLISEEGWKMDDALQRFTQRRMRVGFGHGVSIPSQLRYVRYVDRWTNSMHKKYMERRVEICEVHVWGLRDGVKVSIEGYEDGGKRIKNFHTFTRDEKTVTDQGRVNTKQAPISSKEIKKDMEYLTSPVDGTPDSSMSNLTFAGSYQTVVLRPSSPVRLPTSDINIDFERRNKAAYTGFTVVTSIAHVWFNAFFEGGYEGHDSGVFEIEWDAMDGIKGSARKGTRALEKLKVVWKYVDTAEKREISEPGKGEPVPEIEPADWKGDEQKEAEAKHSDGVDSSRPGGAALTMGAMINAGADSLTKELGLRKERDDSVNVSRASSINEPSPPRKSVDIEKVEQEETEDEGVQSYVANGEAATSPVDGPAEGIEGKQDTKVGGYMETGMAKVSHMAAKWRGKGTDNGDRHAPTAAEDASK